MYYCILDNNDRIHNVLIVRNQLIENKAIIIMGFDLSQKKEIKIYTNKRSHDVLYIQGENMEIYKNIDGNEYGHQQEEPYIFIRLFLPIAKSNDY